MEMRYLRIAKIGFVTYCHRSMNSEDQFTENIRVRVPKWMREAFDRIGKKTLKKEAELAREALLLYLKKQGEPLGPQPNQPSSADDLTEQHHKHHIAAAEGRHARGKRKSQKMQES
jgi:hypothetical protein